MLSAETCRKARKSRDPRFDGKFFIAVKTTGIYCRSICPVMSPKEENVRYYPSAVEAAQAGFRPCLRCRPDSAPGSPVWNGVNTTLERAIRMIHSGSLQDQPVPAVAARLGVSDRYLRRLFQKHLGVSPKTFALYHQCLFAKQLLHQTHLPIHQIALASGFNSVRRFNDCFQNQLALTPTQVRRSGAVRSQELRLHLSYRPPYDWTHMRNFLQARAIPEMEWLDERSYGRTFSWSGCHGHFTAEWARAEHKFLVTIECDDLSHFKPIVLNIRRLLDLDVDIQSVEDDLQQVFGDSQPVRKGLRLPGCWNMFEAGVCAILSQQATVPAAANPVANLVRELGRSLGDRRWFPAPEAIAESDLAFLSIPNARRRTLQDFARHFRNHANPDDPQTWSILRGIGPGTVKVAQMRGTSHPDVFLDGDLGVARGMAQLDQPLEPHAASPWQSYLTLQLWSLQ
ncbi:DNA-3-methyladenine glycosylase 2 family protein [Sulfidibacter corallicola]|uniref:DNA-3-methyladenine glycosylase 2 family protein n=1 Tax=Sulfidibacter corallicola TaxID=2818388 RepID=A0A8A4TJ48_SULCO|nr:AlkA N-terminal domain-containing protein [Sulfidibacter corallicola]QTD48828.1 DNA-3-methyladenine glycosylase 2 family protein [Sulfidibacter corallicola]